MTAIFTAASLLLAGGAGLLASLLVAPLRSFGQMAALLLASAAAIGLGLLLLVGVPAGVQLADHIPDFVMTLAAWSAAASARG